jgi:hypothetical protein
MEAYSVLSVRESRANFDLLRRKNPAHYEETSEEQFAREHHADLRDMAGNTPIKTRSPGSYAAERMAELKE